MGRHSEPEPERRQGGLRWKGDTTGSIPVVPPWESHEGITEETVGPFVAGIRATYPPGTDVPAEHARFSWLVERWIAPGEGRGTWIRQGAGFSAMPYRSNREAAVDILDVWLRWNHVTDPAIRRLHTIWVRHATEAAWSERLDGR